ncbi:signal-transducing histidine kinase-like protein [Haloferax larsenii JCM 13917]|nr:HAMP domain-containing sensor histidine kinase [Haloferax larsenii]ELZ79537.1 signal-transducing histidine kinase-like protein [Haloferax larsenii JCM 13917]
MKGEEAFDYSPGRIAAVYAVFGFVWVLVSDYFVEHLPNHALLQTSKGLVFVALSAGLVYVLVNRSHTELAETTARLETTLTQTSVLHRVLRHDIRNACTAILGYTELVEPRSDAPDDIDPVVSIQARAQRLVEVSDEVSLLRSVEKAEGIEVEIDLVRAVTDAVEDTKLEHPDAAVSVDIPPAVVVEAHPALPRGIAELLDNAAVHGNDDPAIEISVTRTGEEVCVTVADDGPGIPKVERDAIINGAETPLTHTTGIGLWLVWAAVEASGGSLDVETRSPHGTVVSISIPITADESAVGLGTIPTAWSL